MVNLVKTVKYSRTITITLTKGWISPRIFRTRVKISEGFRTKSYQVLPSLTRPLRTGSISYGQMIVKWGIGGRVVRCRTSTSATTIWSIPEKDQTPRPLVRGFQSLSENTRLDENPGNFKRTNDFVQLSRKAQQVNSVGDEPVFFRIDAWSKCNPPQLELTVRCHSELCLEHMSNAQPGNSDNNPKIIFQPITCHRSFSRRIYGIIPQLQVCNGFRYRWPESK